MDTAKTKGRIIELLGSTKRDGMEKMVNWLIEEGFFVSPASTKYHGCYNGGLANHSLRLYELMYAQYEVLKLDAVTSPGQKPFKLEDENIVVACLLHDTCKVGAYIGDGNPYRWNKSHPEGHALLSIAMVKRCIKLEPVESLMIRFHMGLYALNETYKVGSWEYKNAEYPLRGDHSKCEGMSKEESQKARYGKSLMNAWYHNPVTKIMYFMDEISTFESRAAGETD